MVNGLEMISEQTQWQYAINTMCNFLMVKLLSRCLIGLKKKAGTIKWGSKLLKSKALHSLGVKVSPIHTRMLRIPLDQFYHIHRNPSNREQKQKFTKSAEMLFGIEKCVKQCEY